MSTDNATDQRNMAIEKVKSFKEALQDDYVQNQLKAALADNADTFKASLVELFSGDGYLMQCDPKAVIVEALKAAVIKLPINKSLGFAWVIAYSGKPQFQVGYKGLIQLAIRSGQYRHIHADVVYEGEYRSANKLTGEFDLTGIKKSENVIGYFAHFELMNEFSKTLYMTKEKVEAHGAKYSKSYNNSKGPWKNEFDAMAKKTVLTNLLKHYGLLSVEMVTAFENDADQDAAGKVMDEIKGKANRQDMGFAPSEVIGTKVNEQNGQPVTGAPF